MALKNLEKLLIFPKNRENITFLIELLVLKTINSFYLCVREITSFFQKLHKIKKMDKYIFANFKNTKQYREKLINNLRSLSNIEVGGSRLYDGYKNHLTQNPFELTDLIFYLKNYQKKNKFNFQNYLEVGFYSGFTNTILNKFFNFKDIVVVDNLSEEIDANNFLANLKFKNITLIVGNSHNKKTLEKVTKITKYDLIHIDGNHSYTSVKKDFNNYYNLLNQNGILLLHDIINKDWPGVKKFYNELKKSKKYKISEIVHKGNRIDYGIGIVVKK